MEPFLELIHVVSPPLGFSQPPRQPLREPPVDWNEDCLSYHHSQRNRSHCSASPGRFGTELPSRSWPLSGADPMLWKELWTQLDEEQLGGWDRFAFVCSTCNATKSMFEGTFLDGHKLADWKFLFIFADMCSWRNYTQRAIADKLHLDKNTVSQWAVWIREALAVYNKNQLVQLGGPCRIVYINKVFTGTKWKYQRGDRSRGLHMPDPETGDKSSAKVMLLILCEKDSGRIVICHSLRANQVTIKKIFVEHVLPGYIAHTDGAAVYAQIPTWGDYDHESVNHSEGEFVRYDDQEFISSNKVEGVNSALKKFLRKNNGFVYSRVRLALEEFIYHRNNTGPAAYADLRTVMRDVSLVGSSKTLLDDAKFHSVFWDY